MTGENRKQNIADELAKASDAFRAADTLINAGLPNDAVSRTYYGAFHLMRAALLSRGIEAKTHAGTIKLFNRELTHKNVLPPFNKLLTGLAGSREAADYETAVSFTVDEARGILTEVETFRVAVLDLLQREGWLKS